MFPLGLAPLPVSRLDGDAPVPESAAWADFVTDDAIRLVNAGACYQRMPIVMEELSLSSCDEDFAGLALSDLPHEPAPRVFAPVTWPKVVSRPAVTRENRKGKSKAQGNTRATPPALPFWDARDASAPARTGFRWWGPSLVGVAATFVISAVLFIISQQSTPVIGVAAEDVAHPEHAQFFEPKLELPEQAKEKTIDQPMASTGFSVPR